MISGKTKIFGIFGYPVEHTFSPAMHNAAFKKLGWMPVMFLLQFIPTGWPKRSKL